MIYIELNENFKNIFNIVLNGSITDQVKGRAKALRIANKLSKKNKA